MTDPQKHNDDDKIVSLAGHRNRRPADPLIKLPPLTKSVIAAFLGIHLIVHVFLPESLQYWLIVHFGFIPAAYTGGIDLPLWSKIAAPVSYMLLHGSWPHVIMNGVMLAAFGSGTERWLGAKKMAYLMIGSGLLAATLHGIFHPYGGEPVIGASGGISGLFAGALAMMYTSRHTGTVNTRMLLPAIIVWLLVSVGFGMMGGPDGGSIAWIAHIGGFLGGFALLRLMKMM